MKKIISLAFAMALSFCLYSAESFKTLHKMELPFKPTVQYYQHTSDFKFFLCSSKTEMLMFDGITGKILWHVNFEKDFSDKKFSNQLWNKHANVILLFDEDSRKGVAPKYFIDGTTGKQLWKSDKYVSDFGKYELAEGFISYYDADTKGVLLPTKEKVDFVNAFTGDVIWSKQFDLTGKAKHFDCFIMKYYDLVKVNTSKEDAIYLTTTEGKEISDIEPYFNKKKYLADRKHSIMINIPEKNMYVLMQGETSLFWSLLGADLPNWKMNFIAYEATTNKEIWRKVHKISYVFDWIDNTPYVKMGYEDGLLYVLHMPFLKTGDGLTVLNADNGELLWKANYSTAEMKSQGLSKVLATPFPAPAPLFSNGKVYVVDLMKRKTCCFEAKTGKVIWESDDLPKTQMVSHLILSGESLILGYGGQALKVAHITQTQTNGPTKHIYRREYHIKDNYGVIAYNANTGKVLWEGSKIGKKAKDKFKFISGMELVDGKLYCATDKNFFVLNPDNGDVVTNVPVKNEKVGDIWKMFYFENNNKIILNGAKGIVKIDALKGSVEGSIKTPNVPYYSASTEMNYDDFWSDYAVFTNGNPVKMKFKEFAVIDLDNMKIRGKESTDLLFTDTPRFSEGAEMFYKPNGAKVTIHSVK
jgi:outer membrane protein assembly factor BamB